MTYAYADPPYIGLSGFYPEKQEVDHAELIQRMVRDYPAGWALSLHTPALKWVLPLCPADVRVMAWVKPFCSFKPGVRVAYAWEPVIVRGGRKGSRTEATVRDWVSDNITLRRGMVGAKPDGFCVWLFQVLGLAPEDEFHDLFPGSGAVSRAWERYRQHLRWAAGEQLELACS